MPRAEIEAATKALQDVVGAYPNEPSDEQVLAMMRAGITLFSSIALDPSAIRESLSAPPSRGRKPKASRGEVPFR